MIELLDRWRLGGPGRGHPFVTQLVWVDDGSVRLVHGIDVAPAFVLKVVRRINQRTVRVHFWINACFERHGDKWDSGRHEGVFGKEIEVDVSLEVSTGRLHIGDDALAMMSLEHVPMLEAMVKRILEHGL